MSFYKESIHARSFRIHCFKKQRKIFSLGEKAPVRADEEWGKVLFPDPFPPSATVPPLPDGEGYSLDDGFYDSALRLRAE